MGAWGTALYSNDAACDIRSTYLDRLKFGDTNEEAYQYIYKLLYLDIEAIDDTDEMALFWYAIADTLWNYGRLTEEVREKALYYMHNFEDERWKEEGEKKFSAWKNTLKKLEDKLNTPQPPEKKVSKYKPHICKWKMGDVYAYQMLSDFSKENGCYGKYIVFRKTAETYYRPVDIIPIVYFYNKFFDIVPDINEVASTSKLTTWGHSWKEKYYQKYYVELISTSSRNLPKEQLYFIGNIPLKENEKIEFGSSSCGYVGFEGTTINRKIEKDFIERYSLYNADNTK